MVKIQFVRLDSEMFGMLKMHLTGTGAFFTKQQWRGAGACVSVIVSVFVHFSLCARI